MSLWKKLLWIAVTLLGLGSLAVLALSRGEQISALWIVVAGFCASFCGQRGAGAAGWSGARGAVRFLAGNTLDFDRRDARRRGARYDRALCVSPARRKNARPNGEGRNWRRRGRARDDQRARD